MASGTDARRLLRSQSCPSALCHMPGGPSYPLGGSERGPSCTGLASDFVVCLLLHLLSLPGGSAGGRVFCFAAQVALSSLEREAAARARERRGAALPPAMSSAQHWLLFFLFFSPSSLLPSSTPPLLLLSPLSHSVAQAGLELSVSSLVPGSQVCSITSGCH